MNLFIVAVVLTLSWAVTFQQTNGAIGDCGPSEFECRIFECINSSLRCDSLPHCSDHSDEIGCFNCDPDEFTCNNGECIDGSGECDGPFDCDDGSDEFDCSSLDSDDFVGLIVGVSVGTFFLVVVCPIIVCLVIFCCVGGCAAINRKNIQTAFETAPAVTSQLTNLTSVQLAVNIPEPVHTQEMVECGGVATLQPSRNRIMGGQTSPDDRPLTHQLCLIKYTDDDGDIQHIRIFHKIAVQWIEVGHNLRISDDHLAIIRERQRNDPEKCAGDMMDKWLRSGQNPTWTEFIEALEDSQLTTLAKDLKMALPRMVD